MLEALDNLDRVDWRGKAVSSGIEGIEGAFDPARGRLTVPKSFFYLELESGAKPCYILEVASTPFCLFTVAPKIYEGR
jgi:hypothetical protein